MSFDIEYQVYAFERPYDAWEQVKKFAREMRDRKSYDACADFQAALRHYRSLLILNVVQGGKGTVSEVHSILRPTDPICGPLRHLASSARPADNADQ